MTMKNPPPAIPLRAAFSIVFPEAEGFAWYAEHPERLPASHGPMGVSWEAFCDWRKEDRVYWVMDDTPIFRDTDRSEQ